MWKATRTTSENPARRPSSLRCFSRYCCCCSRELSELGFSAYEAMQVNNAVDAGAIYAAANAANTFSATTTAAATVAGATLPSGLNTLTATPAPTQFCGCPSAAGSVSNSGLPRPYAPRPFRPPAPGAPRPALMPRSTRRSITWSCFRPRGACRPRSRRLRSSGQTEQWTAP